MMVLLVNGRPLIEITCFIRLPGAEVKEAQQQLNLESYQKDP